VSTKDERSTLVGKDLVAGHTEGTPGCEKSIEDIQRERKAAPSEVGKSNLVKKKESSGRGDTPTGTDLVQHGRGQKSKQTRKG